MNLPVLATELTEKTLWYPTILGILVVVAGVVLFCGSVYLLLATNLGGRLGFLIAFTALAGFMVVLTSLWITTGSPLNTLKGRIPSWEAIEDVKDLADAKTTEVRDIVEEGREVDPTEAANVKSKADEVLVKVQALPGHEQGDEEAAVQAKFAKFEDVTRYLSVSTYEIGGSKPNPLDFELTHKPLYAVIEYCEVTEPSTPFGVAPPAPQCDPTSDQGGFLVLERDLGSLRVPPVVAWISSILMFGLGLLALHWRERDEQAAEQRAASLAPVPAKV